MNEKTLKERGRALLFSALLLLLGAFQAQAAVEGLTGTSFNFTAKAGHISTGEGNSVLVWGFANDGGTVQYPGPTLILDEDVAVTVNLTNELPVAVSIVFPGQSAVSAIGGTAGLLTNEAPPGGSVSYTFTPTEAGTYTYYSGTNMDLQVEMGLLGAIIVRPAGFATMDPPRAYAHADSAYDREVLMVLTDMDPSIHELVEFGRMAEVDTTTFFPVYWFVNGRNAPDTLLPNYVPWLPTQPYNCLPRIHPGERLLIRWIGGNRDLHPFHTHGNNFDLIARDGRLLSSAAGAGADLAYSDFTQAVAPGATYDAIFSWTGEKLGWDMYGPVAQNPHTCNDTNGDGFDDTVGSPTYHEYCPDHDKPFPVTLPKKKDLTFGQFYSGSPFMGASGFLPPGEGGFNANGGFFYMWHSHAEKEMTNFDIFPGGMMTMLIIEPPSAPID